MGKTLRARIIPTILTNGVNVVKGEKFDNWRTVGNVEAIARLFSNRNVDELMFLDVEARSKETLVSLNLIEKFAQLLNIPFSIGGGISSIEDARLCLRAGAEKIVLGTCAQANPALITEIASEFGTQAVVVAVDMGETIKDNLRINSGRNEVSERAIDFLERLENLGAGEILLQSVPRDGTMNGLDQDSLKIAVRSTNHPIIISGGCSSSEDAINAIFSGASAVAVGALFQFTEITPQAMSEKINEAGIRTRKW